MYLVRAEADMLNQGQKAFEVDSRIKYRPCVLRPNEPLTWVLAHFYRPTLRTEASARFLLPLSSTGDLHRFDQFRSHRHRAPSDE